ncbi:MAG: PhoH family protein [Erysipelothrix sp.]|nr:PhoH family protein [Erysipelothrix sp.]
MEHIDIDLKKYQTHLQTFTGINESNLKLIEQLGDVQIHYDTEKLSIVGEHASESKRLIQTAFQVIERYNHLDIYDIQKINEAVKMNREQEFVNALDHVIARTHKGKPIRPKTLGQKVFVDKITHHDLTFAIGPAGTGKTFLAVCLAVEALKKGDVEKIILTRPAVEAGENLGFLPGDLKEKVDPYLRPLYDALDEMLSNEKTERYIEKGIIEIAPLAYMRGRTLDNAVVILDEAQNTTRSQMLMFLSRLGRNSKMIITGDMTQIDLLKSQPSGLKIAQEKLSNIKEIAFMNLTSADIVRHPLVIKIIDAFDKE